MRRTAVLLALAVPAVLALTATPAPAATGSGTPAFTTTLLQGSSGSAEPRVTVAPKDSRFLTTNAKNGDEIVYRSTDGELAQFVQIYQADLATIGVKLTLKPLESAAYSEATNKRQYQMSAASSAACFSTLTAVTSWPPNTRSA